VNTRIRILSLVSVAGLAVASGCHSRKAEPPSPTAAASAASLTPAEVDQALAAQWTAHKLTPAPRSDDATFLRRVTLDLTGLLPTPEAVLTFLDEQAPDKRARVVDALLASPAYADHWTAYWDEVLLGVQVRNDVDRGSFRRWLHRQFELDRPWDEVAFDLIAATGQSSLGGEEAKGPKAMDAADTARAEAEAKGSVNGAVNWVAHYENNPQDLAGATSRVFLGVQIQCAQCHDHKTEAWKQHDFQSFAAAFVRTKVTRVDKGPQPGVQRRLEVEDKRKPVLGGKKAPPEIAQIARAHPRALDGTDLESDTPRRALAQWVTAPKNPWFGQALVNRLWGKLLGHGFVEPIDDLRPSNVATSPELLKALADDFAGHGFKLKRTLRTLVLTEAYQKAVQPDAPEGESYWCRGSLRALGPEELLNALFQATQLGPALEEAGIDNLVELKGRVARDFTFLFDVDEEVHDDSFNGTIPQALLLLNGQLVNRAVRPAAGTTLAKLLDTPGDDGSKVDALYLRTLSRLPTDTERARWIAYVNEDRLQAANQKKGGKNNDGLNKLNRLKVHDQVPKVQAYEDLLWALVNSSEFVFNH
jgi:hypothetical protein